MKILESERLYLREFDENDIDEISKTYSDEDVMRYIGKGGAVDIEQSKKMISAFMKNYIEIGFGLWAVIEKESNSLIGHCGFNILKGISETEIAYLYSKSSWGKGYATEIGIATLNYGFERLDLTRVIALAYPENTASQNVIRKLGMKHECEREFFGINFLVYSKET
ncbi:MAG: GNAT family N-acetyltransferase [Ignavibacteria bacterium]